MKTKILIIDDEVSFAEMLKLNLESTGEYEVRTEYKGEYGVSTARQFMPDVILLDIIMPGQSGLEVLETLKNDSQTASISVVMMSALTSEGTKQKAARLHDEDYIEKPFSFEELRTTIKNVLKI